MEGILNTIGWPVLAMIATWFIASKIGKAKYTALAEQAHGWIGYAQRNLSKLDDLVIDAADDFEDGKIDPSEIKSKIAKAKELAKTLKSGHTLDDAKEHLALKAKK